MAKMTATGWVMVESWSENNLKNSKEEHQEDNKNSDKPLEETTNSK